jgi:TnpA family transposase
MPEIHRWQYQYLGLSTFPKSLSIVELRAFFTFSEEELSAIRSRRKVLRVAAAIQLGFLKMTGCPLSAVRVIPPRLLRHVATQLGTEPIAIATLRAIYDRPKTLYEHQWWAMQVLGFTKATATQLKALTTYLTQEASYASTVDQLIERAKLWVYQRRYITVGERDFRERARRAMADSELGLLQLIRGQLSPHEQSRWEAQLLKPRPSSSQSTLEWLQQPPRRKSINALRERQERIAFLKGLGVDKLDLEAVPIEKIRTYAAQMHNMRPTKFRELADPTRSLRLVCYLKMALMQASDAAIMLASRQIAKIVRNAYDGARDLEAKTSLQFRAVVEEIFDLADDPTLSDAAFRDGVRKLKKDSEAPKFPTRAAAARWILSEPTPAVRALLSELGQLELKGEAGNETAARLSYLRDLHGRRATALPTEPGIPTPKGWKDLIEGEDRERAMRALEAATLVGLRKSLRSGAVFVDHSERFRGRQRVLIDEARWKRERAKRYAQLNLPHSADVMLDRLVAELGQKLAELDAAIGRGTISVDDGAIHLPRVPGQREHPEVARLRDALFKKIGVVQLPDLILDVDSHAGFSKVILGRPARNPTELLQVYAGMLAHACALDATGVSLMVPQLKPNQILAGMKFFEDRALVRAANDAVVGFQRRLPITALWGDGTLASSDMMSLDVSRQIWVARLDPKRRVPSVGTYTHVSDFWSVIFDQPIVLNERQAGAAIEGAIRQTEVELDRLAVDTHGYTEFAMAIAKLLGFALCPRLARLAERKLYVPSQMVGIPASLESITVPAISLAAIRAEWDDLVRFAASIETGHTTATVALARFGSAAADSPIYRAGVHLGRLIRSLYLCDYFLSEDLRRTVNRILVHGEAVHTLQRAINAGTFSKPRGQHEDELHAISGALTLVTNLCLAWTAHQMQEHLFGDSGVPGAPEDLEWLQQVSPAHYSNINFHGTFSFAIRDYQEWLFSDAIAASA